MLRKMSLLGLGVGIVVMGASGVWAQTLSATEYLAQVREHHPGLQAAQAAAQSAERLLGESKLLTTPYAFAEGQKAYDHSESLQPLMYGEARWQNQLTLGVEEQTLVGTRYRVFHQTVFTGLEGADLNYVGLDQYYTCRTGLEVVQDLWQNAWGKNVRSMSQALEAKHQGDLWERRYQIRQIEIEAEILYGRLVLAKDVVRIQEELLARAERLTAWVRERVAMKLQDRSDLMQAQSQVEARKLELSGAQDQARMAAQVFNQLRGQTNEDVPEDLTLVTIDASVFPNLAEAPPATRLDVRAQEYLLRAAQAQAERQQDTLRPEVQARAALYVNGLDKDWSPAFSEAQHWEDRGYMIGLNVRVPLDWFTRSELETGYAQEVKAAEYMLAQRRLEAESEWRSLRRRLQDYQSRWNIALALETLQKEKADYERQRLRRGNSLTFQVLQFEQEWGQSQLARVQVEDAIRELLLRVKLYQEFKP